MSEWSVVAFCPCGWSDSPAFGDVWFTKTHHRCCPSCGGSASRYFTRTAQYERRRVGTRKLLGLIPVGIYDEYWVMPDGSRVFPSPISPPHSGGEKP